MDEHILIQKVKKGDKEAFKSLFLANKDRVYRFVRSMINKSEDVDEIVIDVFFKAFHDIKNFKEKSKFSTWLYRIAHNTSIDYFRKKKRELINTDKYQEYANQSDIQKSLAKFEITERESIIRGAIEKIDPENRDMIKYVFFEGLKQEEIAELLDIQKGTVYSRLHNAKKKLKLILLNEGFVN
ncbi:MAG: hypothetical protein A2452_11065 [Candidatus Firestonebacteria bacterium RIFOXYC2_FULL_39_67]|nr:MAG: hypothetical protein A2452_11065 [Candidatus Firestonebacteria bacterium RIFOXYC2_FULL_39_67]